MITGISDIARTSKYILDFHLRNLATLPVAKRLCVIFMACSCPCFVLGRLNEEETEISAYASSG